MSSAKTVGPNLPAFVLLDEPLLAFSSNHADALHRHPLMGLARHGAFDSASFGHYVTQLRVAYVGPRSGVAMVRAMRDSLQSSQQNSDKSPYAQPFPGFKKLFGVDVGRGEGHVLWPEQLEELGSGETLQDRIRAGIFGALQRLASTREQFDVAMVYFPDRWLPHLRTKEFDAHDELKALAAQLGIPTQVINDKSIRFGNLGARAWRLAIALYAKAGGTPWKLAPTDGIPADTAYIGLAYAIRRAEDAAHYVTCCSQVFDTEGGGMQFVAFQANDIIEDLDEARRNPFLSQADMRAVLTRSLRLYMDGHPGRPPKRLVIHKTTAFTESEIQGVRDATQSIAEVECLEVGSSSAWRGMWMVAAPGKQPPIKPHGYPVPRGTMVMTSGSSALLWIAGNAPTAVGGRDYFQGGKSIPKPIVLRRHLGQGPFDLLAFEAMALAKMDWNNDALYDPLPVTIMYSQRLARTISNVPSLPSHSYPYRLFM